MTSEVSRLSSSMPHLIVFTILSLPNFFLYSKFCFLLQIFLLEAVYFDVSVTASDSLNKKSKPAWVINIFFRKERFVSSRSLEFRCKRFTKNIRFWMKLTVFLRKMLVFIQKMQFRLFFSRCSSFQFFSFFYQKIEIRNF